MGRRRSKKRCQNKGQALVELLVLTPVLLMLLLAASDFGKLFVISGKSEVAARYGALRWFRHAPFDQIDTLYEEPENEVEAAETLDEIFFLGALNDEEEDDDVGYYEMTEGDFEYEPPDLGNDFWDAMLDLFDQDNSIFAIRANRATFSYDLPVFPYGRRDPLEDEVMTPGELWGQESEPDPLGPYPLVTAKGDFVYLAEAFDQGGGEQFMDILEAWGLVRSAPLLVLDLTLALLILFFFLSIG